MRTLSRLRIAAALIAVAGPLSSRGPSAQPAPGPKPVHVRIDIQQIRAPYSDVNFALLQDATLAFRLMERALFADSLIVRPPLPPGQPAATFGNASSRVPTLSVRGWIVASKDELHVCLGAYDVLMRPIAIREEARIRPNQLDSLLTSVGRRYARVFAQDRTPPVAANERC